MEMNYDPRKRNHGLPHDPFLALVVPRPIGWISTVSTDGTVNLAPYSFFNAVSGDPPTVMFASSTPKDTRRNVEATGEFVASLATFELREQMNLTSATLPSSVSESEYANLEMSPSLVVKPPRVKAAPTALECVYLKTVELSTIDGHPMKSAIIIGQVVNIYIDDAYILDGKVDMSRSRPVSRLGYFDYGVLDTVFTLPRPD